MTGHEPITIEQHSSGSYLLKGPFHPSFPYLAQRSGAKWDNAQKAWRVDKRDLSRIRGACRTIFGYDDRPPTDLVDLCVTVNDDFKVFRSALFLFGRQIARATSSSSGAKIGRGVSMLHGDFTSGGSIRNWKTCVDGTGAVFEIKDIPRRLLNEELPPGVEQVTIVDESFDRKALLQEQQGLLARLAAIGEQLDDNKKPRNREAVQKGLLVSPDVSGI